ncbi:MAG: hypothetical protein IPI35_27225 [Deltaproteobacteria bacterium]|nr:hypothetical protein [Deltaproteobacteria bacterium]
MQILLIEDDRRIADLFTRGLTEEGHRVEHVTDLLCAQARLELSELDLLIRRPFVARRRRPRLWCSRRWTVWRTASRGFWRRR